jgi:hypothetical protein
VFRELRVQESIGSLRNLTKANEINEEGKLNIPLLLFTRQTTEEEGAAFV